MQAHAYAHGSKYLELSWRDATPQNPRGCSFCGSMHPEDLAEDIRNGATLQPTDQKYGWPHKFYVAGSKIGGIKFYTEHLKDAAPADRDVIQQAMGLAFDFQDDGTVTWARY